MPYHKVGVYDAFHSFKEAKAHYKRCRTPKIFMLDKQAVKKLDPVCAGCNKRFSEHNRTANAQLDESLQFQQDENTMAANHCWYFPQTKRCIYMQYICSWVTALDAVYRQAERVY
jgi:hypothetical protein